MKLHSFLAAFALASLTACAAQPAASAKPKHTFAIGTNDFPLDGQRFLIRCGAEMGATLRMNCMMVGASGFKPLDFERFCNCGEFATIRNRTDGPASFLTPSNSTGLEFREACLMRGDA